MKKLTKVMITALCSMPLLAACGSPSSQNKTTAPTSDANVKHGKNQLDTAKPVVGKTTVTDADMHRLKPMLTDIFNQFNEIHATDTTHAALKNFFMKTTQGVYFPSAIHNGQLQEAFRDVKVNIPNQKSKVTYRIANHYIVEIFNDQVVMRPTHTVQGISGVSSKNQTVNSQQAQMLNTIYGDLIAHRVRNELPKDDIQAIRYVPMKVLKTTTDKQLQTKYVLMNQQLKLKNGDTKAQNVVMKLNYSQGQVVKTAAKTSRGNTTFKTPQDQIKTGQLISFSLSDNHDTVNLLNDKLNQKALGILAQNSITDLNNSNARPKLQ